MPRWLAGCMGFVWGHAASFLRCVASPFHSFVTRWDALNPQVIQTNSLPRPQLPVRHPHKREVRQVCVLAWTDWVGSRGCAGCAVTLCVCDSDHAGWLVAWGLCECTLVRSSTVWLFPFTVLQVLITFPGCLERGSVEWARVRRPTATRLLETER